MPVPLPNLDNRRWRDLVEEGRTMIPRYAPEWTDHNLHDPGIALVDLFAWLAEMAQYRLNRVSSRHRRKFVSLVGFEPAGPQPAAVVLSINPPAAGPAVTIPAGVEFEGTSPESHPVPFRTLRAVTISSVVLRELHVELGGTIVNRTAQFFDRLPFDPLGPDPRVGSALYLGFDEVSPNVPIALGFRFAAPGSGVEERLRILEEAAAQAAACRPVRTRFRCTPEPEQPPVKMPQHHSARLVWEAFTTAGWRALENVEPPATAASGQVSDDTRSFTLDGIVEVNLPGDIAQAPVGGGASLFYVRARLIEGVLDAAPVLVDLAVNAASAEQAVSITQAFPIQAGVAATGVPPAAGSAVRLMMSVNERGAIQSLDFGAGTGPKVTVYAYTAASPATEGLITLGIALVGIGTGLPDQQIVLRDAPVDASTVRVYTLSATDWREWTRRNDFDASTRMDANYVLDSTTGQMRFPNGERGRVPEPGALVFASYRITAAAGGNLDAGLVTRLRRSPVNDALFPSALNATVTNRSAAEGGKEEETLTHTIGRAVETLHAHERLLELTAVHRTTTLDEIDRGKVRALPSPTRGVNLIDIERIALSVPGTRVARSRAWASLHPSYPCLKAPGVVTVVVVPETPPEMPQPSEGLLAAVWRHLNRRRLVTTDIQVVGPEYVEVGVAARVRLRPGASSAKAPQRIRAALKAFLNPLTGGPDSLGWPFGRAVFRSEVLQIIDAVPGVDHVIEMTLQTPGGSPQCSDIALCPMALVRSGAHEIEVV
jgi:predicted phage baseplate assembly protein